MRVMIGVDGSEGSIEAVRQASRLVSGPRDRVALYYAPPKVAIRSDRPLPQDAVDESRRALIQSVFAHAEALLPEALRTGVEHIVGEQNPRRGLRLAADQWRADLIVVGAHGASTLGQTLLGSVARSLVYDTITPVLIARGKKVPRPDDAYRVIMAVEEVPALPSATKLLEDLSFPSRTHGRVVHVIEPMFGAEIPAWLEEKARSARDDELTQAWVEGYEAEKHAKETEMQRYSKTLPAALATLPPLIVEGLPAKKLLEIATADDIDLIILGTRGLSIAERFFIGSTTEKILTHAPCSLLVMHYGARP
jgi:nucleotide-binding universal stress UspA family protein